MLSSFNQEPYDNSSAAARNKSFLLFVKNKIVANGGTVKAGSTGETYNPSGDPWSTIADISPNNALAWVLIEFNAGIVLGGSGKIWQVLSHVNGSNTYKTTWHNTLPTGGAVNTEPSSAQQRQMTTTFYNSGYAQKHSFFGWTNGCYIAYIMPITVSWPIPDILTLAPTSNPNNINFPVALMAMSYSAGWFNINSGGVTVLEQLVSEKFMGWNNSGVAVTLAGKFETGYNNATVGKGLSVGGDSAGNQYGTKIRMYCEDPASYGYYGSLGAEGYDFAITGTTGLATGLQDAVPQTKKCHFSRLWLPMNTQLQM